MIELGWTKFKEFVDDRNLSIQYVDDGKKYLLKAFDGIFEVSCIIIKTSPVSSDQTDFEDNYKSDGNKPIREYGTLKIAKGIKNPGVSGAYIISIKVPGTVGSGDGRIVQGGVGWFENHHKDDYATICIIDEDDILGGGAGAIVGNFTDAELAAANQGWYFPPDGVIQLDALFDSSFIISGLYLRVEGYKGDSSDTDTFRVNVKWGKRE